MLAAVPAADAAPRARIPYQPFGTAIYRREMRASLGEGVAVGEIIDDFHHFRATLHHDGTRITGIRGEAVRYPWTTCPGADQPLRRLVGLRLESSLRAPGRHTPQRAQCTHLFDAACLAAARVARGVGSVVYAISVPDRVDGRTRVATSRDGSPVFAWDVVEAEIAGPDPFTGRSIGSGFAQWAEAALDPDTAEAALLTQRACVIAGGRTMDLEGVPRAALVQPNPMGKCHTYQPDTVEKGDRVVGSIRNLTHETDILAASLASAREAVAD